MGQDWDIGVIRERLSYVAKAFGLWCLLKEEARNIVVSEREGSDASKILALTKLKTVVP